MTTETIMLRQYDVYATAVNDRGTLLVVGNNCGLYLLVECGNDLGEGPEISRANAANVVTIVVRREARVLATFNGYGAGLTLKEAYRTAMLALAGATAARTEDPEEADACPTK